MTIEHYRGFEIERHHSGPWDVTYEWRLKDGDLGDPIGYERSVAACKGAIDEHLDDICPACKGSGMVRVDPFERELAPCPDCAVQP